MQVYGGNFATPLKTHSFEFKVCSKVPTTIKWTAGLTSTIFALK
jgi:hypothetical protein